MYKLVFCSLLITSLLNVTAQLTIQRNAILYIQYKGSVYLGGSLASESNIEGAGYIQFGGKQMQQIDMNSFSISNLLINADAHVKIDGLNGNNTEWINLAIDLITLPLPHFFEIWKQATGIADYRRTA